MIPQANKEPSTGHIQIDRLRVRFGRNSATIEAVSDVSMTVRPGEFISIIGPSGCGKSTLLNVVAGFVRPSEGKVTVDGKTTDKPGADRGMVFQQKTAKPPTNRGRIAAWYSSSIRCSPGSRCAETWNSV
ncbi:MAG: ATP-binding cassette domain-containing protein [Thiobacillus sp.]